MAYLIGTDEAGYGPNLGPLVISATLWRIPDAFRQRDLYELLGPLISPSPLAGEVGERVVIADSKVLYKAGGSLGAIERGVLMALGLLDRRALRWRQIWPLLDPRCAADLEDAPWHASYDRPLPVASDGAEIQCMLPRLRETLARAGVALLAIRSAVVFPGPFNQLLQDGNKATALSTLTLTLVRQLLEGLADEPVLVVCDKHGGRNKYGPLLQQTFPDQWVEVRQEGRARSVYRFGQSPREVEVRFMIGGECFLPSALASMTSKYLRELAMQAFNHFWQTHVPGLRPTAGYPLDARRFKAEIQAVQKQLGIADRVLWRTQ